MNVNNVLSYFIIRMKKYPFSKSMAVYHVSETLLNRSSNGAPSGRAAGGVSQSRGLGASLLDTQGKDRDNW